MCNFRNFILNGKKEKNIRLALGVFGSLQSYFAERPGFNASLLPVSLGLSTQQYIWIPGIKGKD